MIILAVKDHFLRDGVEAEVSSDDDAGIVKVVALNGVDRPHFFGRGHPFTFESWVPRGSIWANFTVGCVSSTDKASGLQWLSLPQSKVKMDDLDLKAVH